jgi:hypothetical protein
LRLWGGGGKQIQGLPERTANLAAYSLLGVEPIELVVDRLTLTFLGNILQDKTTIEFQIVERQHAMMMFFLVILVFACIFELVVFLAF